MGSVALPPLFGFPRIRKAWKPQSWESDMGRNLNQIIGELALDRQERLEVRYRELKQEVESLREPRQMRLAVVKGCPKPDTG